MPEQLSRFLSDPTLAKLVEHPGQYTLKELLVTAVRAEQIELGVLADSVLTLMEPAFFWDSQNRGGVDINPPPAISVLGHLGDWC